METPDQNQKNADRQYQLEKFGMYIDIFMKVALIVSVSCILLEGFRAIETAITQGLAG